MTNWKLVSLWVLMTGFLIASGYLAYEAQKLETSAAAIAAAGPIFSYPDLPLIDLAPVPIFDKAEACTDTERLHDCQVATYPVLSAKSAYLFDLGSGTPLLTINAESPLSPASTVKLMTALVAVDNYDLNQVLTVTMADLTQSNSLGLTVGEQFTVADLLQALLISSSNEAAQVLANNFFGGATNFVAQMNNKAAQLGLTSAHFTSPEGFDNINQKISAQDLAILAQSALGNEYLATTMSLDKTSISSATGKIFDLTNTNAFLSALSSVTNSNSILFNCDFQATKNYQSTDNSTAFNSLVQTKLPTAAAPLVSSCAPIFFGLKTGTTAQAGEVLVAAVTTPEGHNLLTVVMGSRQRYADTVRILEWALQNYTWQTKIF